MACNLLKMFAPLPVELKKRKTKMRFDHKTAKQLFLKLTTKQQDDILVLCGFDELSLKSITLKHFQNWSFEEVVEILYNVRRSDVNFDNYVDKYKRLKRKAFSRMADILNITNNEEYTKIYRTLFTESQK